MFSVLYNRPMVLTGPNVFSWVDSFYVDKKYMDIFLSSSSIDEIRIKSALNGIDLMPEDTNDLDFSYRIIFSYVVYNVYPKFMVDTYGKIYEILFSNGFKKLEDIIHTLLHSNEEYLGEEHKYEYMNLMENTFSNISILLKNKVKITNMYGYESSYHIPDKMLYYFFTVKINSIYLSELYNNNIYMAQQLFEEYSQSYFTRTDYQIKNKVLSIFPEIILNFNKTFKELL